MATVSEPKTFNHDETQRRVRHPLQLLRKYIRAYVILEGVALTILAAAVLFWLGLAFDFGLFKIDLNSFSINIFNMISPFPLANIEPLERKHCSCKKHEVK